MSDIEDYFDDDDEYGYWEEEPVDGVAAWADDLAEHTVHSPVWQDGDDPNDYWSDWEDYSNDYYDNDPSPRTSKDSSLTNEDKGKTQLKRKRTDDVAGSKRRKLDESDASQATPSEDQPLIKYWTEVPREQSPPLLEVDGLEKVTILKDWRKRFRTDDDQLPKEQDEEGTDAQQVTEAAGGKGSNSRKGSERDPPKSRAQERVLRKPRAERKTSTAFTDNKSNGVTQPCETGPQLPQPKSGSDTATNTNALAAMPNGHENSRKRKQPDLSGQTEDTKVDDKPKRQKGAVSNSKRVTKESSTISDTSLTGERRSTRSGRGGGG